MKTIQLISKGLAVSLFFFLALFISAGRINYWQGWLYVSMNLFMTLMTVLASIGNTELISERLKPGEGIKKWDKFLLGISAFTYLIMIIVSGLDSGRFHWSPNLHWGLYIIAIIFGHSLFRYKKGIQPRPV